MSDQQQQIVVVERKGNGLAVAGLVLGIVGAVLGLIPLLFVVAWICGVLAVVFGAVAWRAVRREPERGRKTMAVWALALGVVAIALGVWGAVIVDDAVDDVDKALEQLTTTTP